MKYIVTVLMVILFTTSAFADPEGNTAHEEGLNLEIGYLEAADDIPLAPGLEEDEGAIVVYDKPGGRIVEEVAYGPVSAKKVDEFYAETLPQLGWTEIGQRQYVRKDEKLTVLVEGDHKEAVVRFTLVPKAKKTAP